MEEAVAPAAAFGRDQKEERDGAEEQTTPSGPQRRTQDPDFVGGLPASTWGHLFRQYPGLLRHLRPWLHRELGRIFEGDPVQAVGLQEMILSALPVLGLHEERLEEELHDDLRSHTTAFVRGLIDFTVKECRREACHLLHHGTPRFAGGLEDSPGRVIYASFRRWRDRSPVRRTTWAAHQERLQGKLVARSRRAGFQEQGRCCFVSSTRLAVYRREQECSPMATTSAAASRQETPAPQPDLSSHTAAVDEEQLPVISAAEFWGCPDCPPSVLNPTPGRYQDRHAAPWVAGGGDCARGQAGAPRLQGPAGP